MKKTIIFLWTLMLIFSGCGLSEEDVRENREREEREVTKQIRNAKTVRRIYSSADGYHVFAVTLTTDDSIRYYKANMRYESVYEITESER